MNKRDMKKFEKSLIEERERLAASIRSIEDASRHEAGRENSGDLSAYAEAGTDSFELETALHIASDESSRLADIEEALRRIEEGSFGTCEMCEKEIPVKRLEVFPAARCCVQCQEQIEKQKQRY